MIKDINKKMSQDDMRLMNNMLILKILREEGAASMPLLSKKTKLTLPAISAIISELEMLRLIKNSGTLQVKRGRFPSIYQLNYDSYHIISLAIGSASISVGLVNLEGKIVEVMSENITDSKSPEQIVMKASVLIEKLIAHFKLSENDILGLGVSMHGIVDPIRGVSIYPAQLKWRNYPLVDKLREKFNFPMMMDNDMNCLLLAEKWFGGAKDIESFAIINVDYGVGMGIMVQDSVLRGEDFGAGQIGHIPINDSKVKCDCGKVGCLEAIASEKAILQEIISEIKEGKCSQVLNLANGDINQINLNHVYEAVRADDELAIRVIQKAGKHLGKGLSILINILNPRMIIVTGGILRGKEVFFNTFKEAINMFALPTNIKNLQICPSRLQEHNDIVGAATLWIEALFTGIIPLGQKNY